MDSFEVRKLIKTQPSAEEITAALRKVLLGELTQDEASNWACKYLVNDDLFEITDFDAWDYLGKVALLEEISPNEYLYVNEDIEEWMSAPARRAGLFSAD